jgi:hypothetical protein
MRPSVLARWLAVYEIDPWDGNRADLRAGEIAAATVNAQGCKKLDGSYFAPEDFMRYARAQREPEALQREVAQDVSAKLRSWLLNNSGHKAAEE